MARFLSDTSCIVAALCVWHVHHERASGEIDRRLNAGETMIVAAPTLVETYSVLTCLPPPNRLSSAETFALLEANFLGSEVETVALTAAAYHRLLQEGLERRIGGGQIYDAVIVACGLAAEADTLLTFNEPHFRRLADDRIQIVVPA